MFIAACVKKGVQPCKGGMFISIVAKTLSKTPKLTRMVRFCGVPIGVNLRKNLRAECPDPVRFCGVHAPPSATRALGVDSCDLHSQPHRILTEILYTASHFFSPRGFICLGISSASV